MKKTVLIIVSLAAYLGAKAQIPQPDPDTTAKHFLTVASIGNLQEASAGQLAAQLGKREYVKMFGQMMVKDHGQAEQQLLQVAQSRNISLSPAATGGIQPDLTLKNAGERFDKLYVHAMVNAHRNTVQTFQTYATTGKDMIVRAFAQQTLPVLKHHLDEIKVIEDRITKETITK